jgi:ER lumen protein retaining receptor
VLNCAATGQSFTIHVTVTAMSCSMGYVCLFIVGLSGKSQIMFAIVFTTRYLDLFTTFISLYNTIMKVIFILSSYAVIFMMYSKFRATYNSSHDTFRMEFLLLPVAGLAVLVNHEFSFLEVCTICSAQASLALLYFYISGYIAFLA